LIGRQSATSFKATFVLLWQLFIWNPLHPYLTSAALTIRCIRYLEALFSVHFFQGSVLSAALFI
jgi:hypothetical protein